MHAHPYLRLMRLHQPVGIWLLLWPCWWSVALASQGTPPLAVLLLFAAGAVLMRSAGCIINDIADRDFDRQVERTRTRPLASGEIALRQALLLLALLLTLALAVALALGKAVVLWAFLSLPLIVLYPFMKRVIWWPQLFLGLTFNWGALMGWAAVTGRVTWTAVILYTGAMFWTLGYDTIYAHQDKKDDARIGVKSTALRLGQNTKPAVALFYTLAIMYWGWAGLRMGNGFLFHLILALAFLQLLWQVWAVDLDDPVSCRKVFVSNIWTGGLLFAAFLAAA